MRRSASIPRRSVSRRRTVLCPSVFPITSLLALLSAGRPHVLPMPDPLLNKVQIAPRDRDQPPLSDVDCRSAGAQGGITIIEKLCTILQIIVMGDAERVKRLPWT